MRNGSKVSAMPSKAMTIAMAYPFLVTLLAESESWYLPEFLEYPQAISQINLFSGDWGEIWDLAYARTWTDNTFRFGILVLALACERKNPTHDSATDQQHSEKETSPEPPQENLLKRTRCATCPRSKNKKTVKACNKCLKPVRGDCSKCVCIDCAE